MLDRELGRILQTLERERWPGETVIAVVGSLGRRENPELKAAGKALDPLLSHPAVEKVEKDSAVRIWMKNKERVHVSEFAAKLRSVKEVAEIFTKQDTGNAVHYIRHYRNPALSPEELGWANDRHTNFLETMAAKGSPEIVALLTANAGIGPRGNQGGAQEAIQRVPWVIWTPRLSESGTVSDANVSLVDLNPLLSLLLNLPIPPDSDGTTPPIPLLP